MAKVVFIQESELEFLGIMYISAVLKSAGHDCHLLIGDTYRTINELKTISPDIIAFSCMSFQYEWAASFSKIIKSHGFRIPIVIGGSHATVSGEAIDNSYVDIICRGEGEYSMLQLCNAIDNHEDTRNIKGLWVKKAGEVFKNEIYELSDINNLPIPDREIYKPYDFFREDDRAYFMVNRGCMYKCSYCTMPVYRELYQEHIDNVYRPIRYRKVDNIIAEILYVLNAYDKKIVYFRDSSLTSDKEWALSFLASYKRQVKQPFICNISIDLIDEETVVFLKDAGCITAGFGIETGDERLRKEILHKPITNKKIYNGVSLLKKYDIPIITYNIFCLPGETINNAVDTVKMNKRIQPRYFVPNIYFPSPGTYLTEYVLKEGYVSRDVLVTMMKSRIIPFMSILKQYDNLKIENLCKFSCMLVKFSLPFPLVKLLIQLPPNIIFDRLYLITLNLMVKPRNLMQMIIFSIKALLGFSDAELCKAVNCHSDALKKIKDERKAMKVIRNHPMISGNAL